MPFPPDTPFTSEHWLRPLRNYLDAGGISRGLSVAAWSQPGLSCWHIGRAMF